jgi:hypothetical protein
MPLRRCTRQVAAIALRAAARHGFALGHSALIASGVISRPTQDVDLVTNRGTGVGAAAGPVEAGLRRMASPPPGRTGPASWPPVPDLGGELAEWHLTAPSGQRTDLQLAYFDRGHDPVLTGLGPVLDLQDVAGSKVCALAGRACRAPRRAARPCRGNGRFPCTGTTGNPDRDHC